MRAAQVCRYLLTVSRAILITGCLSHARGDGAHEEKLEIKYVMIGCAIGLFFLVGFIIVKLYIIRKHLHDNSTDAQRRSSRNRRRNAALPVVKWTFRPAGTDRPEEELLIARVNMRKARFYGNYTKSFPWPKLKLTVVKQGKIFDLLILNVSEDDRGLYMCRVQEFKKQQDRWKASSNCTAATELRVHVLPASKAKDSLWSLFEDVYLCAVLICSVGLLCMCMFTVTVTCQYVQRKQRLKDNYHLVKSPQNSSGETVTSLVSVSPALPEKERKYRKKRSKDCQEEEPPEIPAKVPIGDKTRKPKLLKPQPRKVVLPKIVEENLTYAELDLVKPIPETKASRSGTVYAQILFGEQQL
ncbi:V-set and transmembrane domain-containing protein 4 isoform X1 [Echeneis naucrates]|uniref:V-set and transmembrane domain-containing protein 4 isoform X1 n=1 Tax=Echeneis naucrates TaxID=173247 RepID=UPI001113E6E1|nr:V-set and transmembrane domain-containing protein 4-like isoform X1 [Echeneis naucrates]